MAELTARQIVIEKISGPWREHMQARSVSA